jgi:branched-chain amino acid transport system ATP-binding protein
MNLLLETRGLTKRFGGLVACDQIDLAVRPGEILGVIGPNGSGKTTLFALVSGFLRADAGEIQLEGHSILGLRPSRIAGMGLARTFQIVQPFLGLSVRDNVLIGALKGGRRSLREADAKADELLERTGLTHVAARDASALTIADRKRLEVARALATEPKLLLLDEVMAGLRPVEVDQAVALISRLRASGITIVLVEHLIRAVLAACDRLAVLHQGRKIAEGEPRSTLERPAVIEAYFGAPVRA